MAAPDDRGIYSSKYLVDQPVRRLPFSAAPKKCKLVASGSRNEHLRVQCSPQSASNATQACIAGSMTMRIIYFLEAVEIEREQGDRRGHLARSAQIAEPSS